MATNISIPLLKKTSTAFTDESRIQAEGQKDGEKNIPQMGSYVTAQFEQALIAHGEQAVQRIYEKASYRIAQLQPVFRACLKRLEELEIRLKPISEAYEAREAFVTAASQIVMPVVRIDGRPVGSGSPGPVATALRRDFHRYAEWA